MTRRVKRDFTVKRNRDKSNAVWKVSNPNSRMISNFFPYGRTASTFPKLSLDLKVYSRPSAMVTLIVCPSCITSVLISSPLRFPFGCTQITGLRIFRCTVFLRRSSHLSRRTPPISRTTKRFRSIDPRPSL